MDSSRLDDLSIEELRRLLVKKRQASRPDRLEQFRRTGQVLSTLDLGLEVKIRSGSRAAKIYPAAGFVQTAGHRCASRLLLILEILLFLGLIGVTLNGFSVLNRLNQTSAAAFQQPTLTPTPLIMAVVLPEGHTPPNSPGGAQPNEAEIPQYLRPLVQSLPVYPTPTPGIEQAIRIQIPAINVDAPVVQGDGWEQLMKGVAQHIGTPNPGENGNIVLSGHNDIFGEVFRDLDRLVPGDVVILFTSRRQYTYEITGTQFVEPTRVDVMNPTLNPTLTLISCHPYLVDNHRIIVSATIQDL